MSIGYAILRVARIEPTMRSYRTSVLRSKHDVTARNGSCNGEFRLLAFRLFARELQASFTS